MHKPGDSIFMVVILGLGLGIGNIGITKLELLQGLAWYIKLMSILVFTGFWYILIVLLLHFLILSLRKLKQKKQLYVCPFIR